MENRYASPSFLARPPRSVPLSVRLRLSFGGLLNQLGWFFFGFGMIFVWIFGINTDPLALVDFRGELVSVQGKVVDTIETMMSEGGSEHVKGTPVFQYSFEFSYEGQSYSGQSYSVGKTKNRGDDAVIEFPQGRPQRSRIQNMRTAIVPVFVLFVFLFPIIGLCLVFFGLRFGWSANRLLKIGEYTTGRLVDKQATNTTINNQRVFKLSFEFQTESGQTRVAVARTHNTEKLEDNQQEPLLYDPGFPKNATLLDHLPGGPAVDQNGQITTGGSHISWLCIIMPTLTIVGHSIVFYYLFLK